MNKAPETIDLKGIREALIEKVTGHLFSSLMFTHRENEKQLQELIHKAEYEGLHTRLCSVVGSRLQELEDQISREIVDKTTGVR